MTVTLAADARLSDALIELRKALAAGGHGQPMVSVLVRVIWELWTNARHDTSVSGSRGEVIVAEGIAHVVVRLPGKPFDSVTASGREGARGLDTCGWLLQRYGWTWSYQRCDPMNEIRLLPISKPEVSP